MLFIFTIFIALKLIDAGYPPEVVPYTVGTQYCCLPQYPTPNENQMISQVGHMYIRTTCAWNQIEVSPGIYNYGPFDSLIADILSNSLIPVLILGGTPSFYDGGQGPTSPEAIEAFTRFCANTTIRYQGKNIIWDIWNEPNNENFWPPSGASPVEFVGVVQAAYSAIKSVTPGEIVVSPSSGKMDWNFISSVINNGIVNYIDAFSVHPYRLDGPETALADFKKLRNLITGAGSSIPIMSSEWGYNDQFPNFNKEIQAAMLARQWLICMHSHVYPSIWYQFQDGPTSGDGWGMVNSDFSEKPAYLAASTLISQLNGMSFQQRLNLGDLNSFAFEFSNSVNTNTCIVVWSVGGGADISFPSSNCFNAVNYVGVPLNQVCPHKLIGGSSLISKYGNSLYKLLSTVYPTHNWDPWKFKKSQDLVDDPKSHREFVESFGKNKLGIKHWEDWYSSKQRDFRKHAPHLLKIYKSHVRMLTSLFPEYKWKKWKFLQVNEGYWKQKENQREFLDDLGESLGYKKIEDWYEIRAETIINHGGASLLVLFDSSPSKLVTSVYPEYNWKIYKFGVVPRGWWDDKKNAKEFLEDIFKEKGMKTLDDWCQFPSHQFHFLGGVTFLRDKTLYERLKELYPNHPWELSKFHNSLKKYQLSLYHLISDLFPKSIVHMEYIHPEIKFPGSTKNIELDIFIPEHNLAIEYQGEHHYNDINSDLTTKKLRDSQKVDLCNKTGISLIQIPYWWDGGRESLKATIQKNRPDLFLGELFSDPIPTTPPFKKNSQVMK